MKSVAIAASLVIAALGVIGIVSPDAMLQVARPFETWYGATALRVVFGGSVALAAPRSRAPRALLVVGLGYLVAGLLTPFLGVEFGLGVHDWWVAQGPGFVRLWAVIALAFGSGFVFLLRR
jgi:hypothetical protein